MEAQREPSNETMQGYFKSLSNWGRWGPDDQLGALNFITPQKRIDAAKLVRSGRTVSCARLLKRTSSLNDRGSFLHFMIETGEGWSPRGQKPTSGRREMAKDFIAMDVHGFATTHIDALGHFFEDGEMYNGVTSASVSANRGATHNSIELLRDGVLTRGVLLDVAAVRGRASLSGGEAIMPEDLLAAEKLGGVTVASGDALLVRTGFPNEIARGVDPAVSGVPGLHAACLPWFHEREIAVLATDAWTDVDPSDAVPDFPVHRISEVAMGVRCIDSGDFEALAKVCAEEQRWEFLLCLAPLRLEGATGCPLNPIATF